MNALGSVVQAIDMNSGQLRWAFALLVYTDQERKNVQVSIKFDGGDTIQTELQGPYWVRMDGEMIHNIFA